ncbi:hypothetical protein BGW36DRAFT_380580 [Talaromyces proteolyticus]|uniref:Pyroglutamyl peptidase type I n=1 Tax=Talaromyces proteolyticus TaxID=1131652 RepID=A0AAD4KPA4_9EURO|nr:uncharacterized protein BGW36DRAFT_380580 [Talaromyces proteolyticus]KAH8696265.1 hypothetical protein BGW36DRAFT_380580 [Talaromyces proteolyticus]
MGDIGVVVDPAVTSVDPTSLPAAESINVLVTGFGPFKDNKVNASHLIATSLPPEITVPPKKPTTGVPVPRIIHIHVHTTPISVSYSFVRTQLPSILDSFKREHGKRPDLIIHMGIAPTRKYYSVETRAYRDNYRITDIDGKLGFDDGEKIWKAKGLPSVLCPLPKETQGIALDKAAPPSSIEKEEQQHGYSPKIIVPYPPNEHFRQVWKSYAPAETDIRISEDAGRYLCEFIFYSSLALALEEGQDQSVLFFHVPSATDDAALELGNKVAVALIKSMMTCWIDEA